MWRKKNDERGLSAFLALFTKLIHVLKFAFQNEGNIILFVMFAPPKFKDLKAYQAVFVTSIRDLYSRFGEKTKLSKYSVSDTDNGSPLPVLTSKLNDIKNTEQRLKAKKEA